MQVRFGARSGAAPILLGVGKLLAGLLFGSSLLALLQAFPKSLLGAMLIFSGTTHDQDAATLSLMHCSLQQACMLGSSTSCTQHVSGVQHS